MTEAVWQKARMLRILLGVQVALILGAAMTLGALWPESGAVSVWMLSAVVGLALVALITGVVALIWRRRIWVQDPDIIARKALRRQIRHQHRAFKSRARKLGGRLDRSGRALFITPIRDGVGGRCSMAELGYSPFGTPLAVGGLRLSTWSAQSGVAYRFEVEPGATLSLDFLTELLQRLRADRPELPLNAIHVELDLARLGDDAEGSAQRRITNQIASATVSALKVDLPIHVSLIGLEHTPDLVRAAVLTDSIGESAAFGGFVEHAQKGGEEQIDQLFAQMIKRLDASRLDAIRTQLAPEFSSSLVVAPLQLWLLLAQLRPALQELSAALPPRTKPLSIQSIFFLGTSPSERIIDPASQILSQRFLGQPAKLNAIGHSVESVVTPRHAGQVATSLHQEAFRVRPNAGAVFRGRLRALVSTVLMAGLTALSVFMMYRDYRLYVPLNANMAQRFETYYGALEGLTPGADSLVQRVMLLDDLRAGLAQYVAEGPSPSRYFGVSWSQQEVYRAQYEQELLGGFQSALQNQIENDLFTFNALEDGVSLFSLALTEAQFRGDQGASASDLKGYFLTALAEQGEIGADFTTAFDTSLTDLFALNRPVADRNVELNAIVARTLQGLDTAKLLYASMLRDQELSRRVDLRSLVGPRFGEVFMPQNATTSYLVPFAFTHGGFDRVFEGGELDRVRDSIHRYERLLGKMDAAQTNSLLRQVVDLYSADYIRTWDGFVGDLRMRTASTWAETQLLMAALGNRYENPLTQLVSTLRDNTVLQKPEQDVNDEAVGSSRTWSADKIRQAFSTYLSAVIAGTDERTELDVLVAYARDVSQWIEAATTAADGTGRFLFDEFAAGEKVTPIATLHKFAMTADLAITRSFGEALAISLDRAAMGFVTAYINEAWQREVLTPYGPQLTQSFPFAPGAPTDLPLQSFAEIFDTTKGAIRNFRNTYLSRFEEATQELGQSSTFLPFGEVAVSKAARIAFVAADEIGNGLLLDGKPSLEFRLRVGFLDPGLSRILLSSGLTLHQYSHGPVIWSSQGWPVAGVADNTIRLRMYNRSRRVLEREVAGSWSWFRLAQSGAHTMNPVLGLAETSFETDNQKAALQFSTVQSHNPFAPDFFSRFVLPDQLFE